MREADTRYLTGLRAIAAVMVYLTHSGGLGLLSFGAVGENIATNSRFGVGVFFAISAYCLCLITESAWSGERIDWRGFYLRRVFRIVPLYFVMIAVTLALAYWRGDVIDDLAMSLISHATFLNIILPKYAHDIMGVEWTIIVEFTFYLLFPAFLWLTIRLRWWGMLLLAVVLSYRSLRLEFITLIGPPYSDHGYFTLPFHIYAFAFGMAAYALVRRHSFSRLWSEALCAGSCALMIYQLAQPLQNTNQIGVALATAGLMVGAANPRTIAARLLRSRPLVWTGTISFSIYLVHMTVLWFLPQDVLFAWAGLAITLLVSALTYRFIEKPCRDFGRALVQRGRHLAPSPVS